MKSTPLTMGEAIEKSRSSPVKNKLFDSMQLSPDIRERITSLAGMPSTKGECYLELMSNLESLEFLPSGFERLMLADLPKLKSLRGITETPDRLSVSRSGVKDLIGLSTTFTGNLFMHDLALESLQGAPQVCTRQFSIERCGLQSLEHAPKVIKGRTSFKSNNLTSLVNIHHHITQIDGRLVLSENPIKEGWLYVFLIKNLAAIDFEDMPEEAIDRINFHIGTGLGKAALVKCQMDLIQRGFDDYVRM